MNERNPHFLCQLGPGQGPGDPQPLPHPLKFPLGVGDSHAKDHVAGRKDRVCPWDLKLELGNPFAYLSQALGTGLRGRGRGLSPLMEEDHFSPAFLEMGSRWGHLLDT